MTENRLKNTLLLAYKQILGDKITYGTLSQFAVMLEQRNPHLEIESFQFKKEFIQPGQYYNSSLILIFKAFDKKLNLFKSIQVQCLEQQDQYFTYQTYIRQLKFFKDNITKYMLSDSILKIYDYYQLNIGDNSSRSYPLYFVIESELIYQTLNNCIHQKQVNMDNIEINKFNTKCEHYLSLMFKNSVNLLQKEILVIKNNDDTYSLKHNPLSGNILQDQQKNDSRFQDSGENQHNDEELSFTANSQSNDEMELDNEEEKDQQQMNQMQEQQDHEVIQVQQQEQHCIPKQNFVSTIIERYPFLIESHNNTQIFEIISQHPKYSDFYLFDYDQTTFTFKIKHEQKDYLLKCEQYQNLIEAEDNYKKYEQLKGVWNSMFIPILDCEIVPLEDFTYLVFVEEDLTNQLIHLQKSDYNLPLLFWLISQEQLLTSQNLNVINIFHTNIYLLSESVQTENNEEKDDKVEVEQHPYYLSNPLFGNNLINFQGQKIAKPNLLFHYEAIIERHLDKELSASSEDIYDRVVDQVLQYIEDQKESKQYILGNNFYYMKKFIWSMNQKWLLQKMLPEQSILISTDLEISIQFNKLQNIDDNKLQQIFNHIQGCQVRASLDELQNLLQKLKEPVSLNKLLLFASFVNQKEDYNLKKFNEIFSNLQSLTIDVDNGLFMNCSNISFDHLNQLENVSLNFKDDYMQDYVIHHQKDKKKQITKTSERIQNLLSLFQNKNLKSINIQSKKMFYLNHSYLPLRLVIKENEREMDENSIEQISLFFQKISVNQNQSSPLKNDNLSQNGRNTDKQNEDMEIESQETSEVESQDSDEFGNQNEEKDMSKESVDTKGELIEQINTAIKTFEQLNYQILYQEINNQNVLQIRFEESTENYLQFNLTFNSEKQEIELEIQTNHLQRFSSCCCELALDHQNLQQLAEFWLETEQQIKVMKTLFQYNQVGDCSHIDEINFQKNLYSSHTENLTKLTLELQPCEQIEEQLITNPDFYGLSKYSKLYHLNLVFMSKECFELVSLKPKYLLHKNRSVNTISLSVISHKINLKEQNKQDYYKLPRLVVLHVISIH